MIRKPAIFCNDATDPLVVDGSVKLHYFYYEDSNTSKTSEEGRPEILIFLMDKLLRLQVSW